MSDLGMGRSRPDPVGDGFRAGPTADTDVDAWESSTPAGSSAPSVRGQPWGNLERGHRGGGGRRAGRPRGPARRRRTLPAPADPWPRPGADDGNRTRVASLED